MSGRRDGHSPPLGGLPIELWMHLLQFVPHRDLPTCCRVSKLVRSLATPLLYRRLWLRDQLRLQKVFTVLGTRPHLSALVRVVEIRVFPFGIQAEHLEHLEIAIINTFKHAVNLEELIWTRTGSFIPRTGFQRSRNDRVLRTIFEKISRLRLLELTGDSRFWSPDLLIEKLPAVIERLSLVMPDRAVTERIPLIAKRLGPNLSSLSILSNNAAYIRDTSIEGAAPFLSNLSRLSLVGCKNVTGAAILSVLKRSQIDVTELSLEGLSLTPVEVDQIAKLTTKLRTLAITHPPKSISSTEFYSSLGVWVEHTQHLRRFTFYRMSGDVAAPDEDQDALDEEDDEAGVEQEAGPSALIMAMNQTVPDPNLTTSAPGGTLAAGAGADDAAEDSLLPFSSLHINSPHLQRLHDQPSAPQPSTGTVLLPRQAVGRGPSDPLLSTSFLRRLIDARGAHLTQLRIHRIAMTVEQLGHICHNCGQLEDLVVHLFEPEWDTIKAHLSSLPRLQSVHILASLRSGIELNEDSLRDLAVSSSETLRQIGFRNRVWEVIPLLDQGASSPTSTIQHPFEEQAQNVSKRNVVLRRWDAAQGNWPEAFLVVRV